MFFLHKDSQSIPKKGAQNALTAFAYIAAVVWLLSSLQKAMGSTEDGALAPVLALSLLVLSVSIMGLLIFGAPLMLYIDGKKKEAVQLVVWTIGSFATITVSVLVVMILLV